MPGRTERGSVRAALTADTTQHETESTRALVSASRLTVLEGGEVDEGALVALEQRIWAELQGAAGRRGGQGVFWAWGYWWVRNSGAA